MPERPAPLRRGGFMPSIQAFSALAIDEPAGSAGPRTAPAHQAKAGHGQGPAWAPSSPRSVVFRGKSLQRVAPREPSRGGRAASGVTVSLVNQAGAGERAGSGVKPGLNPTSASLSLRYLICKMGVMLPAA